MFVLIECQTEMDWFGAKTKISVLEEKLKDRPEFSIKMILMGNDKLTRFYIGMPSYDSY